MEPIFMGGSLTDLYAVWSANARLPPRHGVQGRSGYGDRSRIRSRVPTRLRRSRGMGAQIDEAGGVGFGAFPGRIKPSARISE